MNDRGRHCHYKSYCQNQACLNIMFDKGERERNKVDTENNAFSFV